VRESFNCEISGCERKLVGLLSPPDSSHANERVFELPPDRRNPLREKAETQKRRERLLSAFHANQSGASVPRRPMKLPKRNTLRNNTLIAHPVTPIDKNGEVGIIGPLALLELCRWIDQRGQDPSGAKPCNSTPSGDRPPQRPPVVSVDEHSRTMGPTAASPSESAGGDPGPDRAE